VAVRDPVLSSFVAFGLAAGCAPEARPGDVPVPGCSVERQSLEAPARVDVGCLGFSFDEATGGPLTCIPGVDASCGACVTDAIALPVGVQATLAVGLVDPCATGAGASAGFSLDGDGTVFALLAPLPDRLLPDGSSLLFIGVTPAVAGAIEAEVVVATDARNVRDAAGRNGEARFRLVVDAFDP
jgi:hypothetical protein